MINIPVLGDGAVRSLVEEAMRMCCPFGDGMQVLSVPMTVLCSDPVPASGFGIDSVLLLDRFCDPSLMSPDEPAILAFDESRLAVGHRDEVGRFAAPALAQSHG